MGVNERVMTPDRISNMTYSPVDVNAAQMGEGLTALLCRKSAIQSNFQAAIRSSVPKLAS